MSTIHRAKGFTIVELLIVIVVIGILAAITLVAYNGINNRAKAAAIQSDINNASTTLQSDKTFSSTESYPTTIDAANGGKGIKLSPGESYQYTVDNTANPKTFGLTITNGTISYYIDQSGTVRSGVYSGHVAPADNTAIVTTFAGSGTAGAANGTGTAAQFNGPAALAIDASGNIYVADANNNLIRKITPAGVVTTFAGSGTAGSANGTGTAATFNGPQGIAIDSSGNIYVADAYNNRIRKITSAGVVTTLAGSTAGSANGTGTAAQFSGPAAVTVDTSGNVYVADTYNNLVRKITSAGVVTTLAGSTSTGYVNATGTSARFNTPSAITLDAAGNVFLGEVGNNYIRKITSAGVVTTFAGSDTPDFLYPAGMTIDASGTMYVANTGQQTIRKVSAAGVITTVAGQYPLSGYVDGVGTNARFASPSGIAMDASGNIYVSELDNNRIRKIQLP